eukprot:9498054-Pyramimonas_sp.AAC.1
MESTPLILLESSSSHGQSRAPAVGQYSVVTPLILLESSSSHSQSRIPAVGQYSVVTPLILLESFSSHGQSRAPVGCGGTNTRSTRWRRLPTYKPRVPATRRGRRLLSAPARPFAGRSMPAWPSVALVWRRLEI